MNIIKNIILTLLSFIIDYYTIPEKLNFKSLLKRIKLTTRYRLAGAGLPITKNEVKLLQLKNKHKGERCFIIGNGPSLNNLDLTLLKNEFTFGVNAIYTNFEKMGFYPTYHVVEDIFVAEDRANEINNHKGSTKLFGNYLDYCLKKDERSILMNVNMDYRTYKNFPKFSKNISRKIWVGGTVSYLCMQIAYSMGFKEVYLVGFDHNYKIPEGSKVTGNDILSTTDDPNHFNKDYFGKGKRWHDPMLSRMEQSYSQARDFYEKDGRVIKNATAGGKLEIFERINYESIF
jgi:hypothetical protein